MSSIVIAGNTSGAITIAAPAEAGLNTLTLPASTGTAILEDASGVLQMNSGYGSNAAAYGCRAWVNFNGTGTVAIRDSGNVSSITDNGTGDYTINFAIAMPDANYTINANTSFDGGGFTGQQNAQPKADFTLLTTSFKVVTSNSSNAVLNDATKVFVVVHR